MPCARILECLQARPASRPRPKGPEEADGRATPDTARESRAPEAALPHLLASRGQIKPHHFDTDTNQAMLSDSGRKLVVQTIRDELATSVNHRELGRPVSYDELLYFEALRLTRRCLENSTYKPFRIWW